MLVIQAKSGGFDGENMAEITVNGVKIDVEVNECDHYRGLHIVVINPHNGKIEQARAFDTYKYAERLDDFVDNDVPKGYIVVAACKDECTAALSFKNKSLFGAMGSQLIWKLEYR